MPLAVSYVYLCLHSVFSYMMLLVLQHTHRLLPVDTLWAFSPKLM